MNRSTLQIKMYIKVLNTCILVAQQPSTMQVFLQNISSSSNDDDKAFTQKFWGMLYKSFSSINLYQGSSPWLNHFYNVF